MQKHIKGWGEHLGGDADGREEEGDSQEQKRSAHVAGVTYTTEAS